MGTKKSMKWEEEQYDEFAKHMENKFPKMFGNKRYGGFDIGVGWWPIIESLCSHIQLYTERTNNNKDIKIEPIEVHQIKEKFGGLRFYYSGGDKTIDSLVRLAELTASKTCEMCGEPGKPRTGGWIKTLCNIHHTERISSYKKEFKNDLLGSKSFCIMPWVHLATVSDGDVKICCLSKEEIKNKKEPYNLGKHNVIEIYNSSQIRKNRKDMLNGVRISDCDHCWKEEDNGGISQRQTFTDQWINDYPELVDIIYESSKNDCLVDHSPMYYDFRFGNLCNLKCRMCYPGSSSQINKEYEELKKNYPKIQHFRSSDIQFNNLNDWYKTDIFHSNVYDNINHIRKIYVTGGEPTLIDENYNLMNKLVEIDRAKDVTIMLNTNITNLRNDFYDLIVKFKRVELCASVDGFGEIQEYLRYPSNWKQIEKNIKKLASLPTHVSIWLSPTVQNVNLEFIDELFDYINQINDDCGFYRVILLPIILNSPLDQEISILPKDYKMMCLEKITKSIERSKWFKSDAVFVGRYNNIVSRCEQDNFNPKLLKEFKQFTDVLDQNRGQSLKSLNPNLYKILEGL